MKNIPVLQKAVEIIEAIAASEGGGLSAKQLSLGLGVAPATTYRILHTLRDNDWLRESRRGEFRLGFGLARVTRAYARVEHALTQLRGPLRELTEATGLSSKISIREGEQVVTALRAEALRANSISSPVGSRMHLRDSGSVGAVLLAGMPKAEVRRLLRAPEASGDETLLKEAAAARRVGIACALGSFNPAIHAMSARLALGEGREEAAVSIVGWAEDFRDARRRRELARALKAHAVRMAAVIAEGE
ncbi:MAG: helix-turn-helix domain-containing protein [Opitutaceae bacterium]